MAPKMEPTWAQNWTSRAFKRHLILTWAKIHFSHASQYEIHFFLPLGATNMDQKSTTNGSQEPSMLRSFFEPSKNRSRSLPGGLLAPTWPQLGAKLASTWPQLGPQDGAKILQNLVLKGLGGKVGGTFLGFPGTINFKSILGSPGPPRDPRNISVNRFWGPFGVDFWGHAGVDFPGST